MLSAKNILFKNNPITVKPQTPKLIFPICIQKLLISKPVTFALGCEIQGDVKARRIWFYLCNVAPISESSKSKADSIEANGITLNITVRPLQVSNDYAITNVSARPGDSNYASFFTKAPEIPSL